MRVTNKMLSHSFLRDMSNNLKNLQTLQQQMTSGKEIRKPSDNPFKVARAMQLHTDINANKQYNENIKDTINWLDTTDTALDQAGNVLQRVRELLVSAGNAGYGPDEKRAIKDEINQKVGELSQIFNTNFDGKYVFGGSRGTTKPLNALKDEATGNTNLVFYKTGTEGLNVSNDDLELFNSNDLSILNDDQKELYKISGKLSVEISQGVTMEYNVSASDILIFKNGKGEDIDLREVFKNITDHLGAGNSTDAVDALSGSDLTAITDAINNLLKVRSEVGAKQNRMESALDKNINENFNMTEILAQTEDIDITEKTMQYATMQTVYMASLQTSAKVLQPSLMDYLR